MSEKQLFPMLKQEVVDIFSFLLTSQFREVHNLSKLFEAQTEQ